MGKEVITSCREVAPGAVADVGVPADLGFPADPVSAAA